jgi:hypothetical protein
MKFSFLFVLVAQFAVFGATNFTIQLPTGGIKIPVPDGYVEVGEERRKTFPANSPNALLAWFVRTNELNVFEASATNFFRSHFQVQSPKQWTNKTMSDATFAKFVEMTAKENENTTEPIAEEVAKLFKESPGTNDLVTVDIAVPKQLGAFLKTDRVYASLMLIGYSVKFKEGPRRLPMVMGNAIVHVGNKCLFMYAYQYVEKRNVDAAKEAVREKLKPWIEATLAANPVAPKK